MTAHATVRPAKLRDLSDGYRVACEALMIATTHGASDVLQEVLFDLIRREAAKAERQAA